MTLREQKYHIGTSSQVNINRVFVYIMCRNPKKMLQKEGVEEAIK
jgi:hypothetical protein